MQMVRHAPPFTIEHPAPYNGHLFAPDRPASAEELAQLRSACERASSRKQQRTVVFTHDGLMVAYEEGLPAPIDYLAITREGVGIRHLCRLRISGLEADECRGVHVLLCEYNHNAKQKGAADAALSNAFFGP